MFYKWGETKSQVSSINKICLDHKTGIRRLFNYLLTFIMVSNQKFYAESLRLLTPVLTLKITIYTGILKKEGRYKLSGIYGTRMYGLPANWSPHGVVGPVGLGLDVQNNLLKGSILQQNGGSVWSSSRQSINKAVLRSRTIHSGNCGSFGRKTCFCCCCLNFFKCSFLFY